MSHPTPDDFFFNKYTFYPPGNHGRVVSRGQVVTRTSPPPQPQLYIVLVPEGPGTAYLYPSEGGARRWFYMQDQRQPRIVLDGAFLPHCWTLA